jgi:hypothetical protein
MQLQRRTTVLLKLKAKRLYVKLFFTANECSKKVGVTEKTMGKWIKDGGWKQAREEAAGKLMPLDELPAMPEIILLDFLGYIKDTAPHLAIRIEPLAKEYLKLNTANN